MVVEFKRLVVSAIKRIGRSCPIVPAQALLQEEVPGALLGRVTSVAVAAIGIVQGLAMAVAGPLVGAVGMPAFLMLAVAWLAAGVTGAFVSRLR